jgi:predicted AlkP superfamily pyrophosphatase or phosphodiesterase
MALALTFLALLGPTLAPQQGLDRNRPGSTRRPTVRLVVVVTVDQLFPDQLDRLEDWWEGGLERFWEQGWRFRESRLLHGFSETAPGHACIGTGLHPRGHGLVANEWLEEDLETVTYSCYDPDAPGLTNEGPQTSGVYRRRGRSPRNLRAPGLADYVKRADPASIVLSIAAKDRAAIPVVGQRPDWALWWDRRGGSGFMSSTWYGEQLPEWVVGWNAGWVERVRGGPFGAGWTPELPTEELFWASKTEPDDRVGEVRPRAFPHPLPELGEEPSRRELQRLAGWVYDTPVGDELVLQLAERALVELELGLDDHVDVLALGLTSNDAVGHDHGPRSWEATDVLLRLDRRLGSIFEELDERVGAQHWVAVLTSDHGVLPLPEAMVHRGHRAVRIPRTDVRNLYEQVSGQLVERYGQDFVLTPTERGARLSAEALASADVDAAEVRAALARQLEQGGVEFIAYAWTREELEAASKIPYERDTYDEDETEQDAVLVIEAGSYDPERTPDVVLTPRRYNVLALTEGTTHGSPWEYDRHVPMIFYGPGFPDRDEDREAHTVDILPTLLEHLGIDVPAGLDGIAFDPEDER